MTGEKRTVIVIGAGASGMMAAIAAASAGAEVTVLDGQKKPGRKLLMTGNSRCNLTNTDFHPERVYLSSDPEAAVKVMGSVFSRLSPDRTLDLFHGLGLLTTVEHGSYIYPLTGQASSVLEVLLEEMRERGVKLKLSEKVTGIFREKEMQSGKSTEWTVCTDSWQYHADAVILAAGLKAAPQTGSDGSGLAIAQQLSLQTADVLPALTGISVLMDELPPRSPSAGLRKGRTPGGSDLTVLAGIRMAAGVSAWADGIPLCRDIGQLQFTASDLSGIVIFQVSRQVTRALHEGKQVQIRLDLIPAYTEDEVETLLRQYAQRHPASSLRMALTGLLPDRLIGVVLRGTSAEKSFEELPCGSLSPALIREISEKIKCFRMKAVRVRGFDSCQVCAGGVRLTEVDPSTLQCVREDLRGLYLAGEILDIDGPCGGYNLQWAWSSGYTAGNAAAVENFPAGGSASA